MDGGEPAMASEHALRTAGGSAAGAAPLAGGHTALTSADSPFARDGVQGTTRGDRKDLREAPVWPIQPTSSHQAQQHTLGHEAQALAERAIAGHLAVGRNAESP
jgi:hypothetical protein